MNTYKRIFGVGPRGFLISLALLALAWQLESTAGLASITASHFFRWVVFVFTVVVSTLVVVWSIKSLPLNTRGKELATSGAYRYVRHPLYAAFLSCLNFGLAILLNNQKRFSAQRQTKQDGVQGCSGCSHIRGETGDGKISSSRHCRSHG